MTITDTYMARITGTVLLWFVVVATVVITNPALAGN